MKQFLFLSLLLSSSLSYGQDLIANRFWQLEKKIKKQQREIDSLKQAMHANFQGDLWQVREVVDLKDDLQDLKHKVDSLISELPGLQYPENPGFYMDTATWRRLNQAGTLVPNVGSDSILVVGDTLKWPPGALLRHQEVDTILFDHPDTVQVVRNIGNIAKSNFWRHVDHSLYPAVVYMVFDRMGPSTRKLRSMEGFLRRAPARANFRLDA
jgi:cell division protein FtsB